MHTSYVIHACDGIWKYTSKLVNGYELNNNILSVSLFASDCPVGQTLHRSHSSWTVATELAHTHSHSHTSVIRYYWFPIFIQSTIKYVWIESLSNSFRIKCRESNKIVFTVNSSVCSVYMHPLKIEYVYPINTIEREWTMNASRERVCVCVLGLPLAHD